MSSLLMTWIRHDHWRRFQNQICFEASLLLKLADSSLFGGFTFVDEALNKDYEMCNVTKYGKRRHLQGVLTVANDDQIL